MKSIIVILGLLIPAMRLFAQPENPSILIATSIKKAVGYEDNGLMLLYSDVIIGNLLGEIRKELPCVKVYTMNSIAAAVQLDRERALLGGPNYLEEIANAMGVYYLLNIEITSDGKLTGLSASLGRPINGESLAKKAGIAEGDDEQKLDEIDKFAKQFVAELVKMQLCSYKGKISIYVERTDEELRERGNRCGKNNSGYFRETIHKSYSYVENMVLEKKTRMQADGSLSVRSTEINFWNEMNSGCTNCATYEGKAVVGTDAANFTSSDYTQTLKEEIQVDGLAPLNKDAVVISKLPAEVVIEFDTIQGTYMVQVKAVSNKGSHVKSKKITHVTSCRKDPEPDEKVTNEIVVPIKASYGPFKGKPTDKTLQDTKNETFVEKHDGGQAVSTYKVNFSFTR